MAPNTIMSFFLINIHQNLISNSKYMLIFSNIISFAFISIYSTYLLMSHMSYFGGENDPFLRVFDPENLILTWLYL